MIINLRAARQLFWKRIAGSKRETSEVMAPLFKLSA
jgi:hypothetical protein